MNVVIVANGEMRAAPRLREIWRAADLRLAADGGAVHARRYLGLAPHLLIGDWDSLDATTRAWCVSERVEMIQHPREKDQTDLELALDVALARGATEIAVLGAFGGRVDQLLANVLLLLKPARAKVAARIISAECEIWLVTARVVIAGRRGETVSLIPLTERVEGIVTRGLRYPLRNEPLLLGTTRGVSNVLSAARAEVTLTRGVLLVAHLWDATVPRTKAKT